MRVTGSKRVGGTGEEAQEEEEGKETRSLLNRELESSENSFHECLRQTLRVLITVPRIVRNKERKPLEEESFELEMSQSRARFLSEGKGFPWEKGGTAGTAQKVETVGLRDGVVE